MKPFTKAIIFFAIVFAASAIMSSCSTRPLGACYENGYVGYGHAPKSVKGPDRKVF